MKNKKNLEGCICQKCPSYNKCAREKEEKLFCAEGIGKSHCDFSMLGCLCADCPVYKEHGLEYGYYCIHGSASYVYRMNKMI